MTHEIARLTFPEVAARIAAGACVLLPMGSLETHGPQAPMGDFLMASEIARRIANPRLLAEPRHARSLFMDGFKELRLGFDRR